MKLLKVSAWILALAIFSSTLFMVKPVSAISGAFYSIEPVAVPPLADVNSSANGLETPSTPSPVGQNFTVEIHLRGTTSENVPNGVSGVEVHFNFSTILAYAQVISFTNYLGTSGGVLNTPVLYGITPGFYKDDGTTLVTGPPYTDATQFIVAAASMGGGWNGTDGLVAKITFQITVQPSAGQSDFYSEMELTFGSAVDGLGGEITLDLVQDTMRIDAQPLPIHDVAVTDVLSFKTVIGQGYGGNMNVTAADLGNLPETFNLTVYTDTTSFASRNIILSEGVYTTFMFTWITTGFAYGTYTISAYAWPILGETNTANNNFTDGVVTVTIPGDINGDFKITLQDLVILALHYRHNPPDVHAPRTTASSWCCNSDIDNNGNVGLSDLVILALHYGQHYP